MEDNITMREEVKPRTNGWSCPWHPLQVLAWITVAFVAVVHFGFLAHYVPGYWRIFILLIPALLLVGVVLSMGVTTTIDPAENSFREEVSARASRGRIFRPKFDRTKHKHVIEKNYCNLCQINVYVMQSSLESGK